MLTALHSMRALLAAAALAAPVCPTGTPPGASVSGPEGGPEIRPQLGALLRRSRLVFVGTVERGFESSDDAYWEGEVRPGERLLGDEATVPYDMTLCKTYSTASGKGRGREPAYWKKGTTWIWFVGGASPERSALQGVLRVSDKDRIAKAIQEAKERARHPGVDVLQRYARSEEGGIPDAERVRFVRDAADPNLTHILGRATKMRRYDGWPCGGEASEDQIIINFANDLSETEAERIVKYLKQQGVRLDMSNSMSGLYGSQRLVTMPGNVPEVIQGLMPFSGVDSLSCDRPGAPFRSGIAPAGIAP